MEKNRHFLVFMIAMAVALSFSAVLTRLTPLRGITASA